MSGRLRVVIATTAGPSTVRRITPEDPDLRSVICLSGTATALPISGDYDAFVRRPTGVVERDTGHRVYRVDVDRPIEAGRSWQLGLYIAHRLKVAGRLAEDEEPASGTLWATGTLDADLKVGPVERVAEKARRSSSLFETELPVLAIVARENAGDLPAWADQLTVQNAQEVLGHLGLIPAPRHKWRAGQAAVVTGVLLLIAAGVGLGVWNRWPGAASPPVAAVTRPAGAARAGDPASISFDVLDSRDDGDGCGAGIVSAPGVASGPGVCAVTFRVTNHGDRPARFWLYGAVQGAVREYASRRRQTEFSVGTLAPGEAASARVQPPDWMRRVVVIRGLLVIADGPRPQVDTALAAIDLMSSAEIDTLVSGMRALDVELREIFHQVTPAR